LQQEQKQLQRKHLENLKGGHTNPDISALQDLTDSGAHWESNPVSRSKKAIAVWENTPADNTMTDNIKQIIREEDGIRAEAVSKIKARIRANANKNDIASMKSLLDKRIAAKKIGSTIKQKAVQQEYNETTQAAQKLGAAIKQRAIQQKYIEAPGAATKIQKVVRGNKTRKRLPDMIDEYNTQLLIDKVNKLEQRANKINDSAVTIQKKFRQIKRKTTPISISNDAPTTTIQPANLIADNVSRSVVRNSLNKVARNQNLNIKAANI